MDARDHAEGSTGPLRILVENSEYWLSNVGDLAMMDVTLRRLRERWPAARIGVLTDTPRLLSAYFPGVEPVDPRAPSAWRPAPLARLAQRAGPRVVGPLDIAFVTARAWWPQKLRGARRRGSRLRDQLLRRSTRTTPAPRTHEVEGERSPRRASPTSLDAAAASSLVLAMVGQGLALIDDPVLFSRAASVLPSVGFIALRERRKGPDLLVRAGVPPEKTQVTGDDAIELAYGVRRSGLGRDLGICLRVAGYSPVTDAARTATAGALRTAASELAADLVPIVIAEYRNQDRRSTLPLLDGFPRVQRPLGRFARPQDVARQVGGCRVLVSGAYHAAVFALSQGIPVVALTSSAYYDDKFRGLADMFGEGLQVLHLDEQDLGPRVLEAVLAAWTSAADVRPGLRAAAQDQIVASRRAFERVFDLVENSTRGATAVQEHTVEQPT